MTDFNFIHLRTQSACMILENFVVVFFFLSTHFQVADEEFDDVYVPQVGKQLFVAMCLKGHTLLSYFNMPR